MGSKNFTTTLSYQDGRPTQVVAANFTWALTGGLWLKDENGTVDWVSFPVAAAIWGQATLDRWLKATSGWLTGVWVNV